MKKMLDKSHQVDALVYVKHWVNAIALHAPGAPIVFVGTCKDEAPSKKAHHEPISALIESTFRAHLQHTVFNHRDELWFFPIDNTTSGKDPTVQEMRLSIDKAVREQEYVDLEVPVSWLACYDYLRHEFSGKGSEPPKRLSLEQFTAVAGRFEVRTERARDQLLQVLHEFGLLLHFPDPELRGVVILDPQWLLDTFSAIIRDFGLHLKPKDKAALKLPEEWSLLRERALLHPNLIPLLWTEHTDDERRACLQLMCKHNLAVPVRDTTWSLSEPTTTVLYQIPSILPFDLSGHALADLTDALSSKFQSQLPRYTAKPPSEDQAAFFFSFHLAMTRRESTMTVSNLERSALLPEGLFARMLCQLIQEHQFTSASSQRLSRTTASITFGNATAVFHTVPHIGAIRVTTSTALALRTARRFEEMIKSIIEILFPALQFDILLPFDDSNLVYLDRMQQAVEHGQTLEVDGKAINPVIKYSAFLEQRGLVDKYHCMISYRKQANKKFVRRLHDVLTNVVLQNGQPMQVFLDQFGLEAGRQFVEDFCLAISRSSVALPVISLQAIKDMVDALNEDRPDYVLLEWSLMLALHDGGKLDRICPLVVGDSWSDKQDSVEIFSFNAMKSVVNHLALDAVSEKTQKMMEEFMIGKLKLSKPPKKRSVKEVILDLLNFDGLACFQSSTVQQEQNWGALQEYAKKIQLVVASTVVGRSEASQPAAPIHASSAKEVCRVALSTYLCNV